MAINCAAIPENLLESELFGYEKGAFTGAAKQTKGKVELAHGGTFFLDEVGDLPMALQAKLLRFLQERVIERIGGHEEIPVDVRIVCATHQKLKELCAQGRFREDLYYRLSEIVVTIPPLRNREGDAALLAHHFKNKFCAQESRSSLHFSPDAIAAIESHPWPGNVRELRNVVERAVYRWDNWGEPIAHVQFDPFDSPWRPAGMPRATGESAPPSAPETRHALHGLDAVQDLRTAVDAHERAILEHHLGRNRWNQRQTAKALGLTYDQLRHCIRKHGLSE